MRPFPLQPSWGSVTFGILIPKSTAQDQDIGKYCRLYVLYMLKSNVFVIDIYLIAYLLSKYGNFVLNRRVHKRTCSKMLHVVFHWINFPPFWFVIFERIVVKFLQIYLIIQKSSKLFDMFRNYYWLCLFIQGLPGGMYLYVYVELIQFLTFHLRNGECICSA